jgi:hypothetical protein
LFWNFLCFSKVPFRPNEAAEETVCLRGPFQKKNCAIPEKIKLGVLELSYPGVSLSRTSGEQGGSTMRYKPKSLTALQLALGGLPDAMHVEAR